MLKGKAKIDFERWCVENVTMNDTIRTIIDYDNLLYYPETMQQGVLLAFFRERGIEIENEFNLWDENEEYNPKYKFVVWQYLDKGKYKRNNGFTQFTDPDYSTAFTHAIDKACEIYGGEG